MISLLFHHFFHSFVTMKPNLTKLNMTEWDKMQEHQIYNDFDADLFNLRVKAKKLFKEFNRTEDE